MRTIIGPLFATLALVGALPAAAQTSPATDPATSVKVVMTRDPAAERATFTQRARDEMGHWQQTLNDFGARMKARSTAAQGRAMKALDSAWAETKTASGRLQTAGAEDWDGAKAAYRKASHRLALAWQKIGPDKK
jgi:hypothetical protein